VLTIASEYPPVRSGVAATVSRIVEGVRERGIAVDVLHAGDAPQLTVGEFRFPTIAKRFVRWDRLVEGYDLVHLHGPAPLISDALLLRSLAARRPPVLYTHHFSVELEGLRLANDTYNALHRRLSAAADRVVVTTPSYATRLAHPGRRPPEIIPWAVDAGDRPRSPREHYRGDRPLRVLFLGQMRPYKGVPVLVDATAGRTEFEVTIAGGGPLVAHYEHLVERSPHPRPTFLGPVSPEQATELFHTHDVVALPSINKLEAFGVVLLEGMAAGCVPVASDWPGVRDVAGLAGQVVEPRNPDALRDTLLRLAGDPATTAALQQRSMAIARRFRWDDSIDRYVALMRGMVDERRVALRTLDDLVPIGSPRRHTDEMGQSWRATG
jgi:glycosyltransferase involved in cell wall biosynthesis